MSMVKRTYAMPAELLGRFEEQVATGQRSQVVITLIKEWLDERERAVLREAVIEGCREMADLDLEIEAEWHSLEEEVGRAL